MSVEYNFHRKHETDDEKQKSPQRTNDQTALGTKERMIIASLLVVAVTVIFLSIIDVI